MVTKNFSTYIQVHLRNNGLKIGGDLGKFRTCKTCDTCLNYGVQSFHKCTVLNGHLPLLILITVICIGLAAGNKVPDMSVTQSVSTLEIRQDKLSGSLVTIELGHKISQKIIKSVNKRQVLLNHVLLYLCYYSVRTEKKSVLPYTLH